MSRPTAVKALVGVGLATSVAAAVAIPVQASSGPVETGTQTAALMARDRVEAAKGTTSRSSARTSVSRSAVALTAPAAAQSAAVSAGPAGVTAVAKPAPTPTPTRTEEPDEKPAPKKSSKPQSEATSSRSSSSSSSSSSSGSGVSMAFYGWCDGKGLGDNASKVCSAVRSNFGITNIGGYRAGGGDHGTGRAVDVMVTGSRGDAVARWAIDNMAAYDITYVIWKQRIWLAGSSGWRSMEDRGSVTANHYDHVHISVE